MRDSSDDDWTDQDEHEEERLYKEAQENVKPAVEEQGNEVEVEALEDIDEPDILDIDAPDWDQAITPLGVSIPSFWAH